MRAKKPWLASEFGKSSICLHLSLADPGRRQQLAIASNDVASLDQQIDRSSYLINAVNPCPVLT
jgi:hypothetical protein